MTRTTTTRKSQLVVQTLALAVMVFGLIAHADYVLTSNETWAAEDVATKMTGVIDLHGHTLTVSQLKGDAEITDTTWQNADYALLDTISSTGTQCIMTGVSVTTNTATTTATELEIDFSNDTSVDYRLIFALDVFSPGGFLFTKYGGNYTFYGKPALTFGAADSSKKYRVKVGGGTVSLTDLTAGTAPVSKSQDVVIETSVKNTELALFARIDNNTIYNPGTYTFHRLWVKDGAGTEHTFVPARQLSTGEYGILDLEAYRADSTKGFHGNAGTGDFTAGTVTNYIYAVGAADTPGELHIEVASGATNVNESVALTGSLKLVKEGAGTFLAAKTGQTYLGGTEVAAGLFSLPADDTGATGCLGLAGSSIRVAADAILEMNGNVGLGAYSVVLAGGTLRNGTADTSADLGEVGRITLDADSTEASTNHLIHTGLIDLNGHALTVRYAANGQHYDLDENGSFTNGTVDIVSCGWFRNFGDARDMRTVDLRIKAAIQLDFDVKVRNLELLYTGNYGRGNGRFLVYGTYKAGDYHMNCELQNGATLDLGGVTGLWSVEPPLKFNVCAPVTFADGATVTVSLGDRQLKNEQIVFWQTGNAPADSVHFVLNPALNARLVRRTDGLWLQTGFAIRIR